MHRRRTEVEIMYAKDMHLLAASEQIVELTGWIRNEFRFGYIPRDWICCNIVAFLSWRKRPPFNIHTIPGVYFKLPGNGLDRVWVSAV